MLQTAEEVKETILMAVDVVGNYPQDCFRSSRNV